MLVEQNVLAVAGKKLQISNEIDLLHVHEPWNESYL